MRVFRDKHEFIAYLVAVVAFAAVLAVCSFAMLAPRDHIAQSGAVRKGPGLNVVGHGEAVTYVLGIKLEQEYQGGHVLRLTYALSGAIHAWDFEDGAALAHYLEYLESFGPVTYYDLSGATYLTELEG